MLLKIEGLLSAADATRIREIATKAAYTDGRATAGEAVRDVKNNLQATGQDQILEEARKMITLALLKNDLFTQWVLPRRVLPAMFNRYDTGMEYGGHVDNAIMGGGEPMRADVSITVFLNDASEYDGGELVINSDGEANRVKLPIGGAVVYSSTTIHRVMPVTRGSRHAAVIWAQSFVRDEARREMLLELSQAAKWARSVSSGAHEAMKLSKVRANLMRMWAEL